MSPRQPAKSALLLGTVRGATSVAVLLLLVSAYTLRTDSIADAAAQVSPELPALRPERVESPTDPFSLVPPVGARCEEDGSGRSGAAGWRWHAFIVEAGRDLSTLEFGPVGPGSDYDATDGRITAGLIKSGQGVWSMPPAEQPKGLIDPGALGGLVLDPEDYTLRDGRYLVGFACTDATSATRRWWSLEVAVQTSGAPFLTVATDAVRSAPDAATPTSAPVDRSFSTDPASPTTAVAANDGGATGAEANPLAAADSDRSLAGAAETSAAPTPGPGSGPTGVSWSPLGVLVDVSSVLPVGAWGALVVVLARMSYLLARPLRIVPSFAP